MNNVFTSTGGAYQFNVTMTQRCTFNAITSPALVGGQVPLVRFGNGTIQSTAIGFTTTGVCTGVTLRLDGPPGNSATTVDGAADGSWTANLVSGPWATGAGQTVTVTATTGTIVNGTGGSPVTFPRERHPGLHVQRLVGREPAGDDHGAGRRRSSHHTDPEHQLHDDNGDVPGETSRSTTAPTPAR